MTAINLDGFAQKFSSDDDPWATFSSRDEVLKRTAIIHALGSGPLGTVLEVASGNGSNSIEIARRALRLDATEGTAEGTRLIRQVLAGSHRARAMQLIVPGRFPRARYDAIVVAELLYYLTPRAMAAFAYDAAHALRPGGRLVLAHHRIDFYDFTQHAERIHERFLASSRRTWTCRMVRQTARWQVLLAVPDGRLR